MSARRKDVDRFERVYDRVEHASAVTVDLVSEFVSTVCVRLPALDRTRQAAAVRHLIDSAAWTDAALGLIAIELPEWKLRRLVLEDGIWHCSLSKQASLPIWLDDMAEAGHEVLPLAILSALLEARRRTIAEPATAPSVPRVRPATGYAISCDDFS